MLILMPAPWRVCAAVLASRAAHVLHAAQEPCMAGGCWVAVARAARLPPTSNGGKRPVLQLPPITSGSGASRTPAPHQQWWQAASAAAAPPTSNGGKRPVLQLRPPSLVAVARAARLPPTSNGGKRPVLQLRPPTAMVASGQCCSCAPHQQWWQAASAAAAPPNPCGKRLGLQLRPPILVATSQGCSCASQYWWQAARAAKAAPPISGGGSGPGCHTAHPRATPLPHCCYRAGSLMPTA